MKKLTICRICLAEHVPLFEVVSKSLQELYQKLTDFPFVTEDGRPILACSFCCTKLKQCCRLMRKCLEAEELFAQMMNEDYEPKSSINSDLFEGFNGLVKTEIQIISIVDVDQTESIVVKEELPAVCERLNDVIEIKEEHESYDIKEENIDIVDSDKEGNVLSLSHNKEEEAEDDVHLVEFKREMEKEKRLSEQKPKAVVETCYIKQEDLHSGHLDREEAVLPTQHIFKIELEEESHLSELKERTVETYWSTDARKPTLNYRRTKVESILADQLKNRYKCDVCYHTFSKRVFLTRHLLTHASEKPYICDVCQRRFGAKKYLKKHMIIHAGKKAFKCDICQRSFTQSGHLKGHMVTHTGEKPYKCDSCHACFAKKSNLNHHSRIYHSETNENQSCGKPFKCDTCQVSFRTNFDLNRHVRIHTGEKPFKCGICQRGFIQKPHLTSHIRTHTGEKPFICLYCERCFKSSSDLKKHIRVHTGEKPYKCDVCQRCFNQRTHLTNHIRTHTLKNLVEIDFCQNQ